LGVLLLGTDKIRMKAMLRISRSAWTSFVAILFLVSLLACTEIKPDSYAMGSAVPFGSVGFSVRSTESTSDMNGKAILVHARMESLEGQEQARVASQSWQSFFNLVDHNGKKYKCRRILPTDYYYQNYSGGTSRGEKAWGKSLDPETAFSPVPTDWILRFDVPLEAEGFTLVIDNMSFHRPGVMAVPLDR
jgi:hypothetical protein